MCESFLKLWSDTKDSHRLLFIILWRRFEKKKKRSPFSSARRSFTDVDMFTVCFVLSWPQLNIDFADHFSLWLMKRETNLVMMQNLVIKRAFIPRLNCQWLEKWIPWHSQIETPSYPQLFNEKNNHFVFKNLELYRFRRQFFIIFQLKARNLNCFRAFNWKLMKNCLTSSTVKFNLKFVQSSTLLCVLKHQSICFLLCANTFSGEKKLN